MLHHILNLMLCGIGYFLFQHFFPYSLIYFIFPYIHTFIIGHYNPWVRITSYPPTSLILCGLILYMSGGTYNLTLIPKDRFLRNFFMAVLFTLRVFARNSLRGNCRRNIFFSIRTWPLRLIKSTRLRRLFIFKFFL